MDIDGGTTAATPTPCAGTRPGLKRPREDEQHGDAGVPEIPCPQGQQEHQQRQSLQQPATSAVDMSGGTPASTSIHDSSKRRHLIPATAGSTPAAGTAPDAQSSPMAAISTTPASSSAPASAAQSVPLDAPATIASASSAGIVVPAERQSTSTTASAGAGGDEVAGEKIAASSLANDAEIPTLPATPAVGDGDDRSTAEETDLAGSAPAKVAVEKCQMCNEQDRRYCCPRCGKLTCSLACCVRHKREEGCNGQRDKVAFVGLKDFTDVHLRSDFNFLEDAMRCVDGGRRELARRPGVLASARQQKKISARGRGRGRGRGRQQQQQQQRQDGGGDVDGPMDGDAAATAEEEGEGGVLGLLSERGQGWLAGRAPKLQRLVKEAALRGTRLLLMPDGMARRDGNTTTVAGAPGRGRRFFNRGRGGGGRGGGGRGRGGRGVARGVVTGGGSSSGVGAAGATVGGPGAVISGGGGGGGGGSGSVSGTQGAVPQQGAPTAPADAAGASANDAERTMVPPPLAHGAPVASSSTLSPSGSLLLSSEKSRTTASTSRELLDLEASQPVQGGVSSIASGGGSSSGSVSNKVDRGGARANTAATSTATVLWKVDWVFSGTVTGTAAGGGGSNSSHSASSSSNATTCGNKHGDVTVSDPTVSEELSLHEAIAKHLEPRPGNAPLRHRLKRFAKSWSDDAAGGPPVATDTGAAGSASSPVSSPIPSTSALSASAPAAPEAAVPVAKAGATLPSSSSATANVAACAADACVPAPRRRRQLRLFLQRVPCAAKTPLYWELDGGEPLGTALKGKTVIEYPTVYVTVRGDDSTASLFRTLVSEVSAAPDVASDASLVEELEKALTPPSTEPAVSAENGTADAFSAGHGEEGLTPMDVNSEEEEEESEEEEDDDSESESDDSSSSGSSSSSTGDESSDNDD